MSIWRFVDSKFMVSVLWNQYWYDPHSRTIQREATILNELDSMPPDAFRAELHASLISFYEGVLKVPCAGWRPEAYYAIVCTNTSWSICAYVQNGTCTYTYIHFLIYISWNVYTSTRIYMVYTCKSKYVYVHGIYVYIHVYTYIHVRVIECIYMYIPCTYMYIPGPDSKVLSR